MKNNTILIAALALTALSFTAGSVKADSFRFGIGVTPHGTSLSIGYKDGPGRCLPPPPPPSHVQTRRTACYPAPAQRHHRPSGHYETRVQRLWVEGYWTQSVCHRGRVTRRWNPGHWTERTVQVWVTR